MNFSLISKMRNYNCFEVPHGRMKKKNAPEDPGQVQQGPLYYYTNDQPQGKVNVAPSANPRYVQKQQQQVVYQTAP